MITRGSPVQAAPGRQSVPYLGYYAKTHPNEHGLVWLGRHPERLDAVVGYLTIGVRRLPS
jgi:hypothetical protein